MMYHQYNFPSFLIHSRLFRNAFKIPVVSNITQQQVRDNYYQLKMEVKRLIGEEVEKLKVENI